MVNRGLGLPNSQWTPWTAAEVAALFDLAPETILVLCYDIHIAAVREHRAVVQDYVRAHPNTRLLYRPYEPDIPVWRPDTWAGECARRADFFGLPGEVICDNERNLAVEHGDEDWPKHINWLLAFAGAWRLLSSFPLHLGALSPSGNYKAGWAAYKAANLHQSFQFIDVHAYPGCLDDWREALRLFGDYISITEFNQTDPAAYFASIGNGARDACWFLLGGTADQQQYDIMRQPAYYTSFKEKVRMTDYPSAIWTPTANFGYPDGTHGRQGHLPVAIVDHIAQGTEAGVLAWFANPTSNASSHYLVCKDGRVRQFVREGDAAWANGQFNKPDLSIPWIADAVAHSVNGNLLGISVEHEGLSGEPMPEAQYQATLALHRDILARNHWPVERGRIVGHCDLDSVTRRNDPGPAFPWSRLWTDLRGVTVPAPAPVPTPTPAPAPTPPALNVVELRCFPEWVLARLAAGQDFRGAAGLAAFKSHLAALGKDASTPGRWGWPG